MFSRKEVLINCFIIISLWFISGYLFYSVWNHLDTKCKFLFNFEMLFGASITLGGFNGVASSAVFEFFNIGNKKSDKILILLFFMSYIISMFSIFVLNLSWLYYMFSLFSLIGFICMYLEFNPQSNV